MQIVYLSNSNELIKYNKRYNLETDDVYCLYHGNPNKIKYDLFNKLNIKIIFPNDIEIDKEEFKSKYVDFIGSLSTHFESKKWWATQTAAKFRNQIPYILYKLLIVSYILKKYSVKKLIVVDKSFIFNKALYFFSKNNLIEFKSSLSLNRETYFNYKSFLLFFVSVNYSFLRILYRRVLSKYFFNNKLKNLEKNQPINMIKTFAYENSFNEKGQFIDKFFGDLPRYLNSNGYNTISLVSCIGHYSSIIQKIVKDEKNLILPIELFIKMQSSVPELVRLIFLQFELTKKVYFNDIDVTDFFNFYLNYNKNFEISLDHVLHYSAIKCFIDSYQVKSFITTYENIPWEPMCLQAFKEHSPDTVTIGYQHSNVTDFGTNYFLSKHELESRPLPDIINTVGPITKRIIKDSSQGKHPPIKSSCALRYRYLENKKVSRPRIKNKRILVALEGLPDVYHLVNYILNELSEAYHYEIIIRPHPVLPMAKINKHIQLDYRSLNNVNISEGGMINEDFEKVSVVIYRESTIALEAISFGLPVVCFQSHPMISYDPLFELNYFKWITSQSIRLETILNEIDGMDDADYYNHQNKARLYIKNYFQRCTNEKMSLFLNI